MEVLTGVARTALRVARVRAKESERLDRLFDDPLAAEFLRQAGEPAREPPAGSAGRSALSIALAFHVVIRTRFYDGYLTNAVAGGCRQVVLLAAGLDTRAFRLPWVDGVRLFEVDLPELLAFKEPALTRASAVARCDRVAVAADLRADWPGALTAAGLSPAEPTAWLAEGLLVYLSAEDAARLLADVTRLSAPGSHIAFERGDAIPGEGHASDVEEITSLWSGGLGGDTRDHLVAQGWRVAEHHLTTVAASYGRPTSRRSRSGFVTASLGATGR